MLARGSGLTKKTDDCHLALNTGLNVDMVSMDLSLQSLPYIDAGLPNLVNEFSVQVLACVGLLTVTSIRAKNGSTPTAVSGLD